MSDHIPQITAVILAGERPGGPDPLAGEHALHKGLIDVAGKPMIGHVVSAIQRSQAAARIVIAAPQHLQAAFQDALGQNAVTFIDTQPTPATSISAALTAFASEPAIFFTTCDHPLLTPQMINQFLARARACNVDAAVGCVTKAQYQATFGTAKRTFIQLSDIVFSGANLFLLKPERANGLMQFWRQLEAKRKHPIKMARHIGLLLALRYAVKRLSSDHLIATLDRKTGAKCGLIALEDAAAAVDVDKPADIALVQRVMQRTMDPS